MGYPGLEASILDVWMVEPWGLTLVLNLQTSSHPSKGRLRVWRFETKSTLNKIVGKIQNAPPKIS